ncbi:FimV family protein [Psychrobacter immobilis]|uniref:type IV pilus assembly protein FimV n=1 Tax=Psychrobacter immobilis TaxID=498 RepID=UPI0019183012|nr:peptigoglycan-binding protein LysM [Psychrobacter immobilis]
MSCHLSHRLTTVHRAVSMALLCSVTLMSNAQAATFGKTVVTSAQHEPLAANILVTDIRAADFSASLANPTIYQQMGLTPTDSMTVSFRPTSATSGQVFITTSKPVSKPFADVVLAINDKGQSNVIPKTLLMPLNNSLPIDPSKNIVTGAKKPNLPSVSASTAKPLTVRKGAPPPLMSTSNLSASQSTARELVVSKLPVPSLQTNNIRANGIQAPTVTSAMITDADAATTVNTDKPLDILNIQVTRQIQPSNKSDIGIAANSPIMLTTPNNLETNTTKPNLDTNNTAVSASNIPSNTVASATPEIVNNTDISSNTATDNAITQYQVQRNDSLWVIAQQIAQENNLDIPTVMKQIQSQNPDAFINKDAGQLKADAKLSLPSYDVIPSQEKLESAISAQRQYSRRADTPVVKKTTKTLPKKPSEMAQAAKQPEKPVITKTHTLSKAQFSVLAPDHNGSADGTQTKPAATTGNGLSTDILATLKSSRKSAAAQSQSLSKTSSALDSYTKKIQLQNRKLSELQARLKKLRNQ